MDEFMEVPVEDITVPPRTRKDMGDLDALADSIEQDGLLHPIVVTPDLQLVVGERRLRAVRDVLRWFTIPATVLRVPSTPETRLRAERAENEVRKDFTTSEKVAIARALKEMIGNRSGQRTDLHEPAPVGDQPPQNSAEVDAEPAPGVESRQSVAQAAGLGSHDTLRQAERVVDQAVPEVVAAMDDGTLSINAAADVAELPETEQVKVLTEVKAGKKPRKAIQEARARLKGGHTQAEANADGARVMEQWEGAEVGTEVGCPTPVDRVGLPLTANLQPTFEALNVFDEIEDLLKQSQRLIGDLAAGPGGEVYRTELGRKGKSEEVARYYCEHIANALRKLRWSRPHASVCPWCHHNGGTLEFSCTACGGRGWVTHDLWKRSPEDYREAAVADAREERLPGSQEAEAKA
jgi:ParB-like chromosome segregation protein Spo0J